MKITKEKRNIRLEYELDKMKKKKKDNVLILNIINSKINYICYILKSDHRDMINDVSYENKSSLETCFYYCKSYITFLVLYYPYIHSYLKCLRSNNLRIYRNFYKSILNLPNNFYALMFKLKIVDELKRRDVQNSSNDYYQIGNDCGNGGSFPELLQLSRANFFDVFSKDSYIKILFSRIYVKKYHKRIFRILKIVLFYHSLPVFSFSPKFFRTYHKGRRRAGKNTFRAPPPGEGQNKGKREKKEKEGKREKKEKEGKREKKEKKEKREQIKETMKETKNLHKRLPFRRRYFKTPLFKHVEVPPIYLDDYDSSSTKLLVKKKLVKVRKKKKGGNEVENTFLSDSTESVSSDRSLSCLSNSEEEREVNAFLREEVNAPHEESDGIPPTHSNVGASVLEGGYPNMIHTHQDNIHFVESTPSEHLSDAPLEERNSTFQASNPRKGHPPQGLYMKENFLEFVRHERRKNKSKKEIEYTYGNYVLKDIQKYLRQERKTGPKREKKKIYLHEVWKDIIDFDETDDNKNTLIHKACLVSNAKIIFLLLRLNVNLMIYNDKSELPVHCTLYNCDAYLFLLLLHNTVEYLFFFYLNAYGGGGRREGRSPKVGASKKSIPMECPSNTGDAKQDDPTLKRELEEKEPEGKQTLVNEAHTEGTRGECPMGKANKRRVKYIKNGFFYHKKINSVFVTSVVKLYLSIMVKIIELGNFEFLKILYNYNKHIFCYILHRRDMCYFLCSFAWMYNCMNVFLRYCDEMLRCEVCVGVSRKRKNDEASRGGENSFVVRKNRLGEGNTQVEGAQNGEDQYEQCSSHSGENQGKKHSSHNVKNGGKKRSSLSGEDQDEQYISHSGEDQDEQYISHNVKGAHHVDSARIALEAKRRVRSFPVRKRIDRKNGVEIFYSNECSKHIFVPEPSDHPYVRNKIKTNIPENSSRLDVLISNKHGILKLNTFVNFKLKKVERKATANDILRVHDISYLKMLVRRIKRCNLDEYDDVSAYDNFLENTKKNKKNYLALSLDDLNGNPTYAVSDHIDVLKSSEIISGVCEEGASECMEGSHEVGSECFNWGVQWGNKPGGGEITSSMARDNTKGGEREAEMPSQSLSTGGKENPGGGGMQSKKWNSANNGKEKVEKLILLDNDTFVNKHSFNCALNASGVVLKAVDYVHRKKKKKKIFCVVRPPGHHLGTYGAAQFNLTDEDRAAGSQGFCLLNNIAIGMSYAKYKYERFERIAVIDFDIHHGNGTEQIIRNLGLKKIRINEYVDIYSWKGWKDKNDRKNVFFSSIHAFDGYFYPGTGNDTVELEPYIINVTLKKNMNEENFLNLFHDNILIHLFHFRPNLLFLSAGFDGHKLDFVNNGFVKKNTSTYFHMTNLILSLQNKLRFPIISVLEGGYNTSNDMASVFSLSVLEHLLSFYYNDAAFMVRRKGSHFARCAGMANEANRKPAAMTRTTTHCAKRGTLKFPHICVGKKKMDAMFKKYFSVFKEKTKETENLNLTKCVRDYESYLKHFVEKQNGVKMKVNSFLSKHRRHFDSLLYQRLAVHFCNLGQISLPFEAYFYRVMHHFRIFLDGSEVARMDDRELSSNSRELSTSSRELSSNSRELSTSSRELSSNSRELSSNSRELCTTSREFFSVLNSPSDLRDLDPVYLQRHPEIRFEVTNLWEPSRS
ncbi:histone deactylase [Plasmodium cynomolgi strain B]|uniref:histone deacetylase n=1 Tax=Plasmodium cynomolgi (strain B) TaxID=1120755 RepID=K6VF06_PLACD|nr:histone deactylase [Plasmodium cynomolgi strain B]GAB67862.1 histone deactylase [Plasmodium cynomolgi strain B]